jgi:hypothetical protein
MDDITVHVLHEGRALCGKPGVPGSWGVGHKWVRRDSDEAGPRSAVNCPGCLHAVAVADIPWPESLEQRRIMAQRRLTLAATAPSVMQRGAYVDAGGNEVPFYSDGWDPFDVDQPRTAAEYDRAVLNELALIPSPTLQSWIDRSFFTVMRLAQKELARRRARYEVPEPPPKDEP